MCRFSILLHSQFGAVRAELGGSGIMMRMVSPALLSYRAGCPALLHRWSCRWTGCSPFDVANAHIIHQRIILAVVPPAGTFKVPGIAEADFIIYPCTAF